jgi:hypothetical protein
MREQRRKSVKAESCPNLDRTQEAAGSSPASSIEETALKPGPPSTEVRGRSGGGRGRGRNHPFQGGPQARDEVRCYSAELGRAQLGRALLDKPSPKKTAAKTKNTTPIPESSWVKS